MPIIVELFALNHLPQHKIAERVKYLLFQDQFICRENSQEAHQRHFHANEITEIIFWNFRYDTTVTTWNAHPRKVCVLLLAAIKADIGARLATTQQNGSLESDQPLQISNTSVFEAELVQELAELAKSKHLSRQRIPDVLQHKNNTVEDETTSVDGEAQECDDNYETDNEDR
ncbi:hypothetical protein BGX38DRAFT_1263548 [Terfezia claveryi]|nr:hypothetical protein BGX38DRAFT_1263548 [Terfezia claveryi]